MTNPHDDDEDERRKPTKKLARQPVSYVGYIRVSTDRQEENGISLAGQAETLRDYVTQHQGLLLTIHADSKSAYRSGASSRGDLMAAIRMCQATGARLLVTGIDRLSRSLSIMKDLDVPGLEIVSVLEGRMTKKRLKILIKAAQKQSDEASLRSKEAAARRKASGKPLGNTKNLAVAQRRGTLATIMRKDKKVNDLADFIDMHPQISAMTLAKRVDLLNTARHLNLLSEKNSTLVPWTRGSLRKPWKAALRCLEERRELDADDAWSKSSALGNTGPQVSVDVGTHPAGGAVVAKEWPLGDLGAPTSRMTHIASGEPSKALPAVINASGVVQPLSLVGKRVEPLSLLERMMKPSISRPLTAGEIYDLNAIMAARGRSKCDVMDDLGFTRLDASLWKARSNGTKVCGEMIERLTKWIADNASFIPKVA